MGRIVRGRIGLPIAALAWVASAGVALGAGAGVAAAQSNDGAVFRSVKVPALKYDTGDVLDPLAADAPYPSGDPRNLEGIWASLGRVTPMEGQRLVMKPAVGAAIDRLMELENKGTPVVRKGTLCRANGMIGIAGNQFPTQIVQRPEKIIFIAEEGRLIWHVYMNAEHPANIKPSHLGHSIGRWEGNTLVIDTIGFAPLGPGEGGPSGLPGGYSAGLHVVTRFTRANTGDRRNGDRLLMERTVDDPQTYEARYSAFGVSRWRPDLEMLEFNCEESTPASQAQGVIVE